MATIWNDVSPENEQDGGVVKGKSMPPFSNSEFLRLLVILRFGHDVREIILKSGQELGRTEQEKGIR